MLNQPHHNLELIQDNKSSFKSNWYAIYTMSRFEKKIDNALRRSGFTTFLPLLTQERIWSDRIKKVLVPLLPGYVFIKTNKVHFPDVYIHPGFVKFISIEGRPCRIRELEIELLKQIISKNYKVRPTSYCHLGDKVRIVRGPLQGWEGKIYGKKGKDRVVFNFDGIRQAISVEVGMGEIEVL